MSLMSILDTIGADAKKVFGFLGSAKGQAIITTGESLVETEFPLTTGFFNLTNSWLAEIVKTQALASAAAAGTGSSSQKASIALASITPQVLAFATANGLPVPTADKLSEANTLLVSFFNIFAASTASTAVAVNANTGAATGK